MNAIKAPNLVYAIIRTAETLLRTGYKVKTQKWQGTENPPEFFETLNLSVEFKMVPHIEYFRTNIPLLSRDWVEPHFAERVNGDPFNPGETYKLWPHYGSDAKMRSENQKFSHTYMERYWPKFANGGFKNIDQKTYSNEGIRYPYGDLSDLIDLLKKEPDTRQAYLPIFFPEDTGAIHGGRVPCSIGYQFIIRHNYLHVVYQLRSCDFLRHFADDLYLTCRLAEQVRDSLKIEGLQLGNLTTHITSLHIFAMEVPKVEKLVIG
jgi:hypothetical protein